MKIPIFDRDIIDAQKGARRPTMDVMTFVRWLFSSAFFASPSFVFALFFVGRGVSRFIWRINFLLPSAVAAERRGLLCGSFLPLDKGPAGDLVASGGVLGDHSPPIASSVDLQLGPVVETADVNASQTLVVHLRGGLDGAVGVDMMRNGLRWCAEIQKRISHTPIIITRIKDTSKAA